RFGSLKHLEGEVRDVNPCAARKCLSDPKRGLSGCEVKDEEDQQPGVVAMRRVAQRFEEFWVKPHPFRQAGRGLLCSDGLSVFRRCCTTPGSGLAQARMRCARTRAPTP